MFTVPDKPGRVSAAPWFLYWQIRIPQKAAYPRAEGSSSLPAAPPQMCRPCQWRQRHRTCPPRFAAWQYRHGKIRRVNTAFLTCRPPCSDRCGIIGRSARMIIRRQQCTYDSPCFFCNNGRVQCRNHQITFHTLGLRTAERKANTKHRQPSTAICN